MPDALKERLALLQMGEAQGKLKPEHQAELQRYRAQGLVKPAAAPSTGDPAQDQANQARLLETAKARDAARAGMTTIDRLIPSLARVRQLQKETQSATGLAGLREYNPFSSDNQEYDAAVANLTAMARPATRTPGEGPMSDFESRLAKAILPDRWKRDAYNKQALDGLDSLVATSKEAFRQQLGLPKPPPPGKAVRPDAAALRAKYGLK